MNSYDFFSSSTRDDPYPVFDQLREHDPVYRTDFGYWYVSRYEEATTLLRDARLIAGQGVPDSMGLRDGPIRDVMDAWMMAVDGESHARTRRLISRAFTPRAVEAMRPAITDLADRLVADLVASGGGDVIPSLAFPLPMEVVRLLFGVSSERWTERVSAVFDPRRETAPAGFLGQMESLIVFFVELIPERRNDPGDDVFSSLFTEGDNGERLTDAELVANAVLLVTAGFETTMSLITLAVRTLLMHPEQWELLRADRKFLRQTVDEVLRFEPAALSTTRYTTVDVEVLGITIPAGSNVLFSVAAANRDPRRYADPGRFDITRSDIRPITFGGGAHVCIGAALAKMETEIVLSALLDGAPNLRLSSDQCTWQANNPTIRRPATLEVKA